MQEHLNLALIENQLSREGAEPAGPLLWLEESYRNPEAFRAALKRAHDAILPIPAKSVPSKNYDFFHDIVVRNAANPAPAFKWLDASSGMRELPYAALGALSSAKAAAWTRSGVKPGEILCIVMPLGVEFVVTLLAALKTGLTVSVLPPRGRAFLQRRLEALGPNHIAADDFLFSLLPEWRGAALREDTRAGRAENGNDAGRSHAYASGSVAALCFDPSAGEPHLPRPVTCDALYMCAVRDGLTALNLRPGDMVAAPGFHFQGTHPALLLAVLLCGGTYVHMETDDIAKDPGIAAADTFRAFGVGKAVRDILLATPVDVRKKWACWFRDPAESRDLQLWQMFVQALKLEDVLAANLGWRASMGGCILFSVRRRGLPHDGVLPSAGAPWRLDAPAAGESGLLRGYGSFTVYEFGIEGSEGIPSNETITGNRNEWIYAGPSLPSRSGRVYPTMEILDAVQGLPHGMPATVVEVPSMGGSEDYRFALLLFSEGRTRFDRASISRAVMTAIEKEMGGEFLPDLIQFFPLTPRRDEKGEIDHDWCRSQYLTGRLFRKSGQELFVCLAQLRECLASMNKEAMKTTAG